MHEKIKKKELDLIPLHIEVDLPEYIPVKKEEEKDERGVVVIQL